MFQVYISTAFSAFLLNVQLFIHILKTDLICQVLLLKIFNDEDFCRVFVVVCVWVCVWGGWGCVGVCAFVNT